MKAPALNIRSVIYTEEGAKRAKRTDTFLYPSRVCAQPAKNRCRLSPLCVICIKINSRVAARRCLRRACFSGEKKKKKKTHARTKPITRRINAAPTVADVEAPTMTEHRRRGTFVPHSQPDIRTNAHRRTGGSGPSATSHDPAESDQWAASHRA